MSYEINTKKAAQSVKSFIKAHGGDAQHSEILEMLAGVCGFDSYRAMAATSVSHSQVTLGSPANTPAVSKDYALRNLEDESRVVFRSTAVDWQLADNPEISLEEVPAENRTKFDVVLEAFGSQFRLLVKPVGTNLDNFEGRSVLDCLVEVNNGVPCLHLTNDPADCQLISVFATSQGLLVRPDDGDWKRARGADLPAGLDTVYKASCDSFSERENSFVALLDTADKYKDAHESTPAAGISITPAKVTFKKLGSRAYPSAQTGVLHPENKEHVDSLVKVSLDDLIDEEGDKLWLDVDMFDKNGCMGDDDHIGVMTPYSAGHRRIELEKFVEYVSELVAYFVEAGVGFRQIEDLLHEILASDNPGMTAMECMNETAFIRHKRSAYLAILEIAKRQ